jgi:hypothetical protein
MILISIRSTIREERVLNVFSKEKHPPAGVSTNDDSRFVIFGEAI